MSIHDGHRQRLKQRFLENFMNLLRFYESYRDHPVLLLFFSVPRQDTNPIAHALLDHFGSLYQVLEAPVEELRKVKGVGEQSALLLSLMNDVARYYQVDRTMREKILPTVQACGEYLVPFFFGRKVETVFLLCLDAKCKVLCCKEVGQGSVNSAGISVRKIVETALAANATTVVLALAGIFGSVMMTTKDQSNLSVVDQVQNLVRFLRGQKIYPYRYGDEWGLE